MTQYEMRFANLVRHAVQLVTTERERIRMFFDGLNYGLCYNLAREAKTKARFEKVVAIARRLEQVRRLHREKWEANRPRGSGGFRSASSGGQSHYRRGRPFRPAQAARQIPRGSSVSPSLYSTRPFQSSFSALPT